MTRYFAPLCWALMMILFALLARFGWADRDAVVTMLLVMPMLAFVTLQKGRGCDVRARQA